MSQVAASLFLGTVRGCRRISSRHCKITFLTRSELRVFPRFVGLLVVFEQERNKMFIGPIGPTGISPMGIGPIGPMGIGLGIESVGTSASGCAGTAVGFGAVFAAVAGVITGTSVRATPTKKFTFDCRHWPALAPLATTALPDPPATPQSTQQNAASFLTP
jgi:hypothetical protein